MKFVFDVEDRPDLYKALQEQAFRLGLPWSASPLILGFRLHVLAEKQQLFFIDTDQLVLHQFQSRLRKHTGESDETFKQRELICWQEEGWKVNSFDDFFALGPEIR